MQRLKSLIEFLEEDPNDPFLQFALALEYRKLDDFPSARSVFERLVQAHPEYVGTYFHLGKLYEDLNLVELASDTYRRGIETAGRLSEHHARAELQSALMELEIGDG